MSDNIKPILDYLEIEITEFCNLNCRGCCDFSNLATEKRIYPFNEYEKDMHRLHELFGGIEKIRLMGGEPLLNPSLADYVLTARRIFPDADIRIVSNGLLIPSLREETLKAIALNGAGFDISNYPPTRKMLSEIKKKLKASGVKYDIGVPMDCFFKTLRKAPAASPEPAFRNCIFTHCHMMGHGKIAPCSYALCIGRLNREYGLSYPENDVFDLYSDISGDDLINYFLHPHEFCRYCGNGIIPMKWEGHISGKQAKPEDWIIEENFVASKIAPAVQSFLKPAAICLRKIIQRKK